MWVYADGVDSVLGIQVFSDGVQISAQFLDQQCDVLDFEYFWESAT